MITLTEHDADSILKILRKEIESMVSGYESLNNMILSLISSLSDGKEEELEKYEKEKIDNEKTYYKKLKEYDDMILLLTTGSEIK
jgi:hypothetical protein